MPSAAQLAQAHWSRTPLFVGEEDRYRIYPWLYQAAEFREHFGERVLEIGCGTGCDLLQFAKHGAIATGIDITERHLELARERVGTMAEVIRADGSSLPFPSSSFDYIYSHGVIHHSDHPKRIADEITRVLKPGGRFNIHVYAYYSAFAGLRYIRYGKNWKIHVENSIDPVHLDTYSGNDVRGLFPNIHLKLRKYETYALFKPLERWLGWFLVATGTKPSRMLGMKESTSSVAC